MLAGEGMIFTELWCVESDNMDDEEWMLMWQKWEANRSGWELCLMKVFVLVVRGLQISVPKETVTLYTFYSTGS